LIIRQHIIIQQKKCEINALICNNLKKINILLYKYILN